MRLSWTSMSMTSPSGPELGWTRKRGWDEPAGPVETFLGEGTAARVAKMPTGDLYSWAEVGVSGIGRSLSAAQAGRDSSALYEAEQGSAVLLAVAKELRRRLASDPGNEK